MQWPVGVQGRVHGFFHGLERVAARQVAADLIQRIPDGVTDDPYVRHIVAIDRQGHSLRDFAEFGQFGIQFRHGGASVRQDPARHVFPLDATAKHMLRDCPGNNKLMLLPRVIPQPRRSSEENMPCARCALLWRWLSARFLLKRDSWDSSFCE